MQDCSNSSALAMELLTSCSEPWIHCYSVSVPEAEWNRNHKYVEFCDNENTCHMKDPRPYEVCKTTFMMQNKIVQTLDSRHSSESNAEITDMGDKNLFKMETVQTKHTLQWRHIKFNHLCLRQNPHQETYIAGNIHEIIKHDPAHCAYLCRLYLGWLPWPYVMPVILLRPMLSEYAHLTRRWIFNECRENTHKFVSTRLCKKRTYMLFLETSWPLLDDNDI